MSVGPGVDPSYRPVKDQGFTGLTTDPRGAAPMGEVGQDHAPPSNSKAAQGVSADADFLAQASAEMSGIPNQQQPSYDELKN